MILRGLSGNRISISPRKTSYQDATTYLAGFRQASLLRRDNATVISVRRNNGWTTVSWARGTEPVEVRLRANAATARLVDVQGNVKHISARGGYYTPKLPASACTHPATPCLIGGAPLMLVEGSLSTGRRRRHP